MKHDIEAATAVELHELPAHGGAMLHIGEKAPNPGHDPFRRTISGCAL